MKHPIARRAVRRIGRQIIKKVAEEAAGQIADKAADALLKHGKRYIRRYATGKLIRKLI